MKKSHIRFDTLIGPFLIRPIMQADSPIIRDIILETLLEYGATGGGFASSDRDTQEMYDAFQREGRKYFVVEREDKEREDREEREEREGVRTLADSRGQAMACPGIVVGGAGFAPLPGEPGTCELVKMYFRPEIRGLGLGKTLLELCLAEAGKMGYKQIYLETIECMHSARGLYEHLGFKQIPNQMGNTGHYSCDVFYLRSLLPDFFF